MRPCFSIVTCKTSIGAVTRKSEEPPSPQLESLDSSSTLRAVLSLPSPRVAASFHFLFLGEILASQTGQALNLHPHPRVPIENCRRVPASQSAVALHRRQVPGRSSVPNQG